MVPLSEWSSIWCHWVSEVLSGATEWVKFYQLINLTTLWSSDFQPLSQKSKTTKLVPAYIMSDWTHVTWFYSLNTSTNWCSTVCSLPLQAFSTHLPFRFLSQTRQQYYFLLISHQMGECKSVSTLNIIFSNIALWITSWVNSPRQHW